MKVFDSKLVVQYGQQVVLDSLYQKRKLEDCLWNTTSVAEATGEVDSKDIERFHKEILRYAKLYLPVRKLEVKLYEKWAKSPEQIQKRTEENKRIFKK